MGRRATLVLENPCEGFVHRKTQQEALKAAQDNGISETDPTLDCMAVFLPSTSCLSHSVFGSGWI